MTRKPDQSFLRVAFVAIIFLLSLAGGSVWLLRSPEKPTDELLRVVRRVDVEGAPYLVWSNGQVTPDMAAHRVFILRTLAAQSLLREQSSQGKP